MRTLESIFDDPIGPLQLSDKGRWWATRKHTGLDANGRVTVMFYDGHHRCEINGTPDTLRRLAETIVAHCDSAEVN